MSTAGAPNAAKDRQPQQFKPYDPGQYAVNDTEGAELNVTIGRPLPCNQQLVPPTYRREVATLPNQPYGSTDELTLNCPSNGEIRILYKSQLPSPPPPPRDVCGFDASTVAPRNAASAAATEYARARRRAGEMDRTYELLWKLMRHPAIERCMHVEFEPNTEEMIAVLEGMPRGGSLADELSRRRSPSGSTTPSPETMAATLTLASQLALCVVSACHYLHAHNILVSPLAVLPQFVLAPSGGCFLLRNGLRTLAECPAAKTIISASAAAFQPGSSRDADVATAAANACVTYMLAPAVKYRSAEWTALRRFAGLLKMAVLRTVVKLLHVVVCEAETDATAEVPSAKATLDQLRKVLERLGLGQEEQQAHDASANTKIASGGSRRRDGAILLRLAAFVERTCDTNHELLEAESFSFGPLLKDMLEAAMAPDTSSRTR